jgi:hypothetical protein
MTAGADALDSIVLAMAGVPASGREVALLALAAAFSSGVAATFPQLAEPQIETVAREMVRGIRLRLERLDAAAGWPHP